MMAEASSPNLCAPALTSKHEINLSLARAAGLRYLDKPEPGISRQKTEQGFAYVDPQGAVVKDPATLARIEALKIPPAYVNVWISMDPLTHIQVRANDSKGRPQYRYHEIWTNEVLTTAKFDRMKKFGEILPTLHEAIAQDLGKSAPDEKTRMAAVARLLEVAGIRIGSERYVEENGSYGLTTLEVQQISVKENELRFQFVGKEHIAHDITVKDPLLASAVEKMIKGKAANEKIFSVEAAEVNEYIKTHGGQGFSAKDFRTWVGTVTAAKSLFARGPPKSEKDRKAAELEAATASSDRLHNTPTVARSSYIHPMIFEAYASGKLNKAFSQAVPSSGRPAEEAAVLWLLNSN